LAETLAVNEAGESQKAGGDLVEAAIEIAQEAEVTKAATSATKTSTAALVAASRF